MNQRTCVTPGGRFVYGIHKPRFRTENFRARDSLAQLGKLADGRTIDNRANFPHGTVIEDDADWIYEIPNPLPFKGTSYIAKSWADEKAADPSAIRLPEPPPVSLNKAIRRMQATGEPCGLSVTGAFAALPGPLKIALAVTSTDPEDLTRLADGCAEFVREPNGGNPTGLVYEIGAGGRLEPKIGDHLLFEAVANNSHLPDAYKRAMVLRPGAQGGSEIVGEYGGPSGGSHVFEYLRRNSYIPWGHFAANMADDAVRYRIADLTAADVTAMRHLYYQRTFARLARLVGIRLPAERRPFTDQELEDLRCGIRKRLNASDRPSPLPFSASLWGWNCGFDFSPSGYRLNASHQQIHQQFAMVPSEIAAEGGIQETGAATSSLPAFSAGDLVAAFSAEYRQCTGRPFFEAYLEAIHTNRRMDGRRDRDARLTIFENDQVVLHVPKAQTSQWEIQLMCRQPVGNILEARPDARRAVDWGIYAAVRILGAVGAKMISAFEYAKRFDSPDTDQRLLYVFLPRIPQSPGGFSENQLRWITGHYPEDFAAACRAALDRVEGQDSGRALRG